MMLTSKIKKIFLDSNVVVFNGENFNIRKQNIITSLIDNDYIVVLDSNVFEKLDINYYKCNIKELNKADCNKYYYISSSDNISEEKIDLLEDNDYSIIYDQVDENDRILKYLKNIKCIRVCSSDDLEYIYRENNVNNFVVINNGFIDKKFYKYDIEEFEGLSNKDDSICVYCEGYQYDVKLLEDLCKKFKGNIIVTSKQDIDINDLLNKYSNIKYFKYDNYDYLNAIFNFVKVIVMLFGDDQLIDNNIIYDTIACEKMVFVNKENFYDIIKNVICTDNILDSLNSFLKQGNHNNVFDNKFYYSWSTSFELFNNLLTEGNDDLDNISIINFNQKKCNIIIEEEIFDEVCKLLGRFKYKYIKYNEDDDKLLDYYFRYRSFIFISKEDIDLSNYCYGTNVIYSKNLKEDINDILDGINGIKYISNYEAKEVVSAKTVKFLNGDGTDYYSGGAERYLVDLFNVFKKEKVRMDIYQMANKYFIRKYDDVLVVGLPSINNDKFSKEFYLLNKNNCNLSIYSDFAEAFPYTLHPAIGISHGVYWDNRNNKYGGDFISKNKNIYESALNCDKLISVDTNTANCFQIVDFELGNQKTKVIPNYVDTSEFIVKSNNKKDKIIITYPRRLNEPRGMYLLLSAVDDILKKHKNVEIHFVGKGLQDDVNEVKKKMEKYPDRLFCYSSRPDEMYKVYENTDISLIPTMYSEGTSLSCLEAMATGNIVICTRVGGLTDLVINGYNGYLIEPTKEDLLSAIDNIIKNYDKQDIIRKRARETAEIFNKDRWIESWTKIVKPYIRGIKSDSIKLVEFYVSNVYNLSNDVIDIIKKEIMSGNLVYIRSKEQPEIDDISCGLLQLVPYDEEIVSVCDRIYVEKGLEINRNEKIILI